MIGGKTEIVAAQVADAIRAGHAVCVLCATPDWRRRTAARVIRLLRATGVRFWLDWRNHRIVSGGGSATFVQMQMDGVE